MFTRKIAAYIVALVAIVGIVKSITSQKDRRRIAALESRMHEVESDVKATVQVEQMRTRLVPFPGAADWVARDGGLERLRQG